MFLKKHQSVFLFRLDVYLKTSRRFFCILYNHNSTILIRTKRQQAPPRNSKDKVFKAVFRQQ